MFGEKFAVQFHQQNVEAQIRPKFAISIEKKTKTRIAYLTEYFFFAIPFVLFFALIAYTLIMAFVKKRRFFASISH